MTDPSSLRHIPITEYLKRRAYWLEYRKLMTGAQEGPAGVVVEKTGVEIEANATIIE